MRKAFFIILLAFSKLAAQELSPQATFSLVSISPGDELYATFGHSIIHLKDPAQNIDLSFSYGGFDFRTDGFYVKFLRGTLPYELTINNSFQEEINYYWQNEQRTASEQVLNLSSNQKNALFNFLKNNYLPENRQYHYKFFYDNCSSRIRDVLQKVCGDSLKFSTALHADSSYRQWIEHYSKKRKAWSEFGMDIAIGKPSDEKTGWSGAMFLPDNLADAFDSAVIIRNGKSEPLIIAKNKLNHIDAKPLSFGERYCRPSIIFSLLLILVAIITILQFKNQVKRGFVFDKILFCVIGLLGWFMIFLWFGTDHGVTANNYNIIWAMPLCFPIACFIPKKWATIFFLAYAILQILLLLAWNFIPQHLHIAILPISLTLAIRAFFVWYRKY